MEKISLSKMVCPHSIWDIGVITYFSSNFLRAQYVEHDKYHFTKCRNRSLRPCSWLDETYDITEYTRGHEARDSPLDLIIPLNKPRTTAEIVLKTKWWPRRARFEDPAGRIRNDGFAWKYTILAVHASSIEF